MYGRRRSGWQWFTDTISAFYDWVCDFFEPEKSITEQYQEKINALALHLGSYITQNKPVEVLTDDSYTRKMAKKHNAALSLLSTLNPEARFYGKPIKIKDDVKIHQQKGFFAKNWQGLRRPSEVEMEVGNPVTAWVQHHQADAKYKHRHLNYHRSGFGRFFQAIFGTSLVKTKTMRLVEDVVELEQYPR